MPDFHIKHLLFHIVQGVFIHGYPTMFLLGLLPASSRARAHADDSIADSPSSKIGSRGQIPYAVASKICPRFSQQHAAKLVLPFPLAVGVFLHDDACTNYCKHNTTNKRYE
jgi:hypothetical protein